MSNCVLTNTKEFKSLYKDIYGDAEFKNPEIITLAAKIGVWQENNGLDKYPNKKQLEVKSDLLFGLTSSNQEELEFHINTLNVVGQFLENIGIEQRLVPEFLSQEGNIIEGAIAAANFINGTVDIINDVEKGRVEAWNKLPEEAAHFWYRLLATNSDLKKALWESKVTASKVVDLASEYNDAYKNGPDALTEEAIGQLIAEAIKRIEVKNGNTSDYSFLKKFLEWINGLLDIFKTTNKDPFEVAAMKILSSDMSDLMTWEEYKKLNNIVNFSDIVADIPSAPVDYTIIESLGTLKNPTLGWMGSRDAFVYNGDKYTSYTNNEGTHNFKNDIKIDFSEYTDAINRMSETSWAFIPKKGKASPEFDTLEELDKWVYKTYSKEYNKKQQEIIQEVKDNQIFFDRLLNKTFKKKTKFLPKTLKKYYTIVDGVKNRRLQEWNVNQQIQKITKKLTDVEKEQLIQTNGYTNIAPTLKVLPDLLQKYKKNPIVLSEPIKIDGAKKQELSILNGIKEMIKLENPNLKSITAEEFVAEVHNWLETNYLLGFADESAYLSYRTDQTFNTKSTPTSDMMAERWGMMPTEEEILAMEPEEREDFLRDMGLKEVTGDIYHNKVSLRFNDAYHIGGHSHFNKNPSAWGNLTYFYTGKNKTKDAVLLHEIQNDNIERLREYKSEKVDLETSIGRYLQELNSTFLDNLNRLKHGNKSVVKDFEKDTQQYRTLNNILSSLQNNNNGFADFGYNLFKQIISERLELYKSDNSPSNNIVKAQELLDLAYTTKGQFEDLQKRGGIKSLLTADEIKYLEELLKDLNTVVGALDVKKTNFKTRAASITENINKKLGELYGMNAPIFKFSPTAKPTRRTRRGLVNLEDGIIGMGVNPQRYALLNESVKTLFYFSEQQLSKNLSRDTDNARRTYIQARNAAKAAEFNSRLVKITEEQFLTLLRNYEYNQELLKKLVDIQSEKDLAKYKSTDSSESGSIALGELKIYEHLQQDALDKKVELEKNYGKAEEEVKQTLEIEMNYFTPLVHHLIQKHINKYGKDFPMYFSGYNITLLTQGNERTAMIYAGKDEINLVNKDKFVYNNKEYKKHSSPIQKLNAEYDIEVRRTSNKVKELYHNNELIGKVYDGPTLILEQNGVKTNTGETQISPIIRKLKQENVGTSEGQFSTDGKFISEQEYEKAYQQATEQKAKEIKKEAAITIGVPIKNEYGTGVVTNETPVEEAIKALNEFKKITKSNIDRVINTIMNISNNKPIETGAIYNAMSQVSGVKLVWQNSIEGLVGKPGGYLVDLSNYNYNAPVLYGMSNKKSPVTVNIEDRFNEILKGLNMKRRDVKHDPRVFAGMQARVAKANEEFGGTFFEAKFYYTKEGAPRMRLIWSEQSKETKQNIQAHAAYSRWYNSLTKEQKISENALREQEGKTPINETLQKYSNMPKEEMVEVQRKVDVLQKVFNVEVRYDSKLDAAGAVINEGGKPVIVINPNKVSKDTVVHEFAHIFIDALGGLENARVKAAVAQLRGTELWNTIAEAYPELNETDLAKEVLATAMGMKGAEIFNTEEKKQWWNRFVDWVNERIAKLLGKSTDNVASITRMLFNPKNSNLLLKSPTLTQYSKTIETGLNIQKQIDKDKTDLKGLKEEIVEKLKTIHKKLKAAHSIDEGYENYADQVKQAITDIDKLGAVSFAHSIYTYIDFAADALKSIHTLASNIIKHNDIDQYKLNKMKMLQQSFNDIDVYIKAVKDNASELAAQGINSEQLTKTLSELALHKSDAQAILDDATRKVAVHLLAVQSNYAQGQARRKYEIEANKLGLKGVDKTTYIDTKLIENSDKFYAENIRFFDNMFRNSITDIDGFEAWVLDANNINSKTVQIVQSYILKAATNIRIDVVEDRDKVEEAFRKLLNGRNPAIVKPSELYKNIYTLSHGTYYLTSEYLPDFNEEYRRVAKAWLTLQEEKGENSVEALAAKKEFDKWIEENTVKYEYYGGVDLVPGRKPSDKWKNPKYEALTKVEKEYLNFSILMMRRHDGYVTRSNKLEEPPVMNSMPLTINYRLPGVNVKGTEQLLEKGLFPTIKTGIKDIFKTDKVNETELGEITESEGKSDIKKVFTFSSGEEKKEVPVFYRNQSKDQSLDISTLLVMNAMTTQNYRHKHKLLPTLDVIVDATANNNFIKHEGFGIKKLLISDSTDKPITFKGIESKEYKVLRSMIEDNIYGVSTIQLHATILGADANALLKSIGKWTSDSMLMLNYLSAGANITQGKVMNSIEVLSGGRLKRKSLLTADAMFFKDYKGILNDIGAPVPKSKTSRLLELFNVKGDFSPMSTAFFKNSKAAALVSTDTFHALNGMGEFYTASTLMYALLDNIKVMNDNKQYLNKEGKVVATKDEAMSLAEAYVIKDGKLELFNNNPGGTTSIKYTSFDLETPYNPANISNYIQKVYSDLHGQYSAEHQAMAQRHSLAKMMFMLRKWMLPGIMRRYRGINTVGKKDLRDIDKFYSEALMDEQEGNYTTAVKFVNNLRNSMKEMQFVLAYQTNWNNLTDVEKSNIRKTVMELSVIVGSFVASSILYALAKGMDDDDELKKVVLTATFFTRRLYSEMAFFINPAEAIRILRSPMASVSMLESGIRLLDQARKDIVHMDDAGVHFFEAERYVRGPRKGELKVLRRAEQVVPVFKNVDRNLEDATDFLWNSF